MSNLLDGLPDWSRSEDPDARSNYETLPFFASNFVRLDADARRVEVSDYSQRYCLPRMDLARASGLYLFLRLVFDLPSALPRAEAKVFGGWLHPSIDETLPTFDLSWPLLRVGVRHFEVQAFAGYLGKGYDAIGEFDYFVTLCQLRDRALLEAAVISSAG